MSVAIWGSVRHTIVPSPVWTFDSRTPLGLLRLFLKQGTIFSKIEYIVDNVLVQLMLIDRGN